MNKKRLTLIFFFTAIIILAGFGFAKEALATYYTSGNFISTNLLDGVSPAPTSIDSFVYNLSAKPSGTEATVGFNQDGGSTWYDAAGDVGTETLVTSTDQTITLTSGWSGANFYYKVFFTSDGTGTPVLDDITVNYHEPVPVVRRTHTRTPYVAPRTFPDSLVVNQGAEYTNTREVILSLHADYALYMSICNNSQFINCSLESYQETKSWTLTALDGQKTVYGIFISPDGKNSTLVSDTIILDTFPPEPPILTDPIEHSLPVIETAIPTFKGTAEPDSKVILSIVSPTTIYIYTTQTDSEGNWSYTLPESLPDGQYNLQLRARDLAGNESEINAVDFLVKIEVPEEEVPEEEIPEEEIPEEEVPEEEVPEEEIVPEKPVEEMTVEELKGKIFEIQQEIIELLKQLIQLLQTQIAELS